MSHALIIDDNMVISRAIQNRLVPHGFDTFDRTWAEHQAVEAAAHHTPDLIVVGDSIADSSPIDVARDRPLVRCSGPNGDWRSRPSGTLSPSRGPDRGALPRDSARRSFGLG